MSTPKFALNIGEIENAVESFAASKPSFSFVLHKRDDNQFVYKVKKNDSEVTFTMYVVRGGQVSHLVQGSNKLSDLKSVAEQCWEYVVETAHISCVSFNLFKFSNVEEADFESFSSILTENYPYKEEDIESHNANLKHRKCYTDKYGAHVYANYYANGTLTLQGSVTPMFTCAWTECVGLVGDIPVEEQEAFLSYSTDSPHTRIDEDLSSHINNLAPITGTKIELLTKVSIKLANLGIVYEDNAWITFSILKGLDALLTLKLTGGNPANSFDLYSQFFTPISTGSDVFVFLPSVHSFDSNTALKSSLERGYSLLRKYRNTTFHIDRSNIESSVVLSFEQAVDVIEMVLKAMNDICKNW